MAGSGAFSEHLFDGIAGHNVNEQKNQGQDQPKSRQGEQEGGGPCVREIQRSFSLDLGLEAARIGLGGADSLDNSLSEGRDR